MILLGILAYLICGIAVLRSFPRVGDTAMMIISDGLPVFGWGLLVGVGLLWPIFLVLMGWVQLVGID